MCVICDRFLSWTSFSDPPLKRYILCTTDPWFQDGRITLSRVYLEFNLSLCIEKLKPWVTAIVTHDAITAPQGQEIRASVISIFITVDIIINDNSDQYHYYDSLPSLLRLIIFKLPISKFNQYIQRLDLLKLNNLTCNAILFGIITRLLLNLLVIILFFCYLDNGYCYY